jgi:hypothetical protein
MSLQRELRTSGVNVKHLVSATCKKFGSRPKTYTSCILLSCSIIAAPSLILSPVLDTVLFFGGVSWHGADS